MTDITGKKVAFVLTNGYEDSELTAPWKAVEDAGGTAVLIAPTAGEVEGKKGHRQAVDLTTDQASAADYDGLVLPGGVINADHIRMDQPAVDLVKTFVNDGTPVGVICHGAWILIEADAVRERTITSYPSLKTDLVNAGAKWVDEEVAIDEGIFSSRTPDDLPAFNAKLIEEVAEGEHIRS
ncbi:MAG: type 1 glutamine amidotransferase domain-containing protein [Agrococcus casei]|uniref:ThiJ/PfpI family protein n=1 Tax=Agrococcus casei LMG 22410 TaxID=1255656 RepID=A0A1R4G6Z9_9MICO|nr:type 1 glutamine amidotransferase domain-containing protein [Agrococcus casei]SJM63964.1 ThiJ/PfpI family protein [Agrococcus casei LMG 22410]